MSRYLIVYCLFTLGLYLAPLASGAQSGELSSRCPINFQTVADSGFWSPLAQTPNNFSTAFMSIDANQVATISGILSAEKGATAVAGYRVQRPDTQSWSLQGRDRISATMRGDGRTYQLVLEDREGLKATQPYSWIADVKPGPEALADLTVPLAKFVPVAEGKTLASPRVLDTAHIERMGLQITDTAMGAFRVQLQSICVP